MQYLVIENTDTIMSISRVVGSNNVDEILEQNGLQRTPYIAKAWRTKCNDYLATDPPEVSSARKQALLNTLTGSNELFEKACLMDEDEWKIFSAFKAFPDAIQIPESVQLPYSTKVIGNVSTSEQLANLAYSVDARQSSNTSRVSFESWLSTGETTTNATQFSTRLTSSALTSDPVDSVAYRAVIKSLQRGSKIDPSLFNNVNTSPSIQVTGQHSSAQGQGQVSFCQNLPWGKITFQSSVLNSSIDVPAYPETIETMRTANYTSMPDTMYQYEPWIVYQNSGPREQTLNFHLHRDLWTGNHLDGNANKLIRFCEANTYPTYNGSMVNSPRFKVYIDGSLFISGVVTATTVTWSGPIGQDNWYLEFNLSLTMQEVSDFALNATKVNSLGLIGS